MTELYELEKLIASKIQSYASEHLEQQGAINSDAFVAAALDVCRNPAHLYAAGSVTQEEFEDLVNMGVQKAELELISNQALSTVQAEAISTHLAEIIKNTTNEFVEGSILMNVDPDEPWPRK